MTLDLANVIHRQIFMGCFGRYMTVCTRSAARWGDVSRHWGHVVYFTLLAAHRVGPGGWVYALEPNPAAFTALENHLGPTPFPTFGHRRSLCPRLMGRYVSIFLLRVSIATTTAPVWHMARTDWIAADVPCLRLDDVLIESRKERVDLMKMAVEGAEPRVLKGGAECLSAGVIKHLIVEVNGPRLTESGSSPARLVAQLAELGFLPAKLSGRRAIPVSADTWDLDPAHEHDRLFTHRSVR